MCRRHSSLVFRDLLRRQKLVSPTPLATVSFVAGPTDTWGRSTARAAVGLRTPTASPARVRRTGEAARNARCEGVKIQQRTPRRNQRCRTNGVPVANSHSGPNMERDLKCSRRSRQCPQRPRRSIQYRRLPSRRSGPRSRANTWLREHGRGQPQRKTRGALRWGLPSRLLVEGAIANPEAANSFSEWGVPKVWPTGCLNRPWEQIQLNRANFVWPPKPGTNLEPKRFLMSEPNGTKCKYESDCE